MNEYEINVAVLEELQTINNIHELEKIFHKAHITINGGGTVILYRKSSAGIKEKFDQIDNETDLNDYKAGIFKYL